MAAKKTILIGGGTRSGKSEFALSLARQLGEHRLFLATAQAYDDEMRERIARHRRERGDDFETVEEPIAVPETLQRAAGHEVVVLDCLTLWLSNLLLQGKDEKAILERVRDLTEVLGSRFHAVIVTNEVGMGIVPESALGRTFRDVAGLAHQMLGQRADEVYLAVLGSMLRIK